MTHLSFLLCAGPRRCGQRPRRRLLRPLTAEVARPTTTTHNAVDNRQLAQCNRCAFHFVCLLFQQRFPLSLLCCCGFRWWSSLRGRAVVARSNRFVLTSLFFFQFFSLDFFFVWFPRWFPSCFVFFLESGFFFFYQKSCRLAMDFLLLRVFFCCVLPGFQLAGRILFFLGGFLFVCSASFTQFPTAGCGPSWAARYAVGR